MYPFTKANGLGNDFVIFENISFDEIAYRAPFIADRHRGIGCDQVICLNTGFVKFWNSDGSIAAFCGNGVRCVARYLTQEGEVSFLTDFGQVNAHVKGSLVKVAYPSMPKIIEKNELFYKVNAGNKFVIIFGKNKIVDWKPIVEEYQDSLTQGYNLINLCGNWMDVYEFGVGPTKSCGTGAMACAFVIASRSKSSRQVVISSEGGPLTMEFRENIAYQIGDTRLVFKGEIEF